ncbi:tetratricopeptide repeat protein [Thermus caldilimi]|uniref:tetratricopeptide repeat protein n=1 Tax=Thermus caldilimi TaxID=2483360 RepID=UPI001076433B|nr:tetratricopeptide repeat protein [Thermus caldilimi]
MVQVARIRWLVQMGVALSILGAQAASAITWQEGWNLVVRVERGDQEAAKYLIDAYNQGDPDAGTAIGVLYLNGVAYPRDLGRAKSYFDWARSRGSGWASAMLVVLHGNGYGVPADDKLALTFADEAAQRGYPGGRTLQARGTLLGLRGRPSQEQLAASAAAIQAGAAQGEPISLSALARLYFTGFPPGNIPKDWAKARALWEEAMGKGYLLAGNFLIAMYYYGYGGPADQAKAIALAKRLAGLDLFGEAFLATAYYFGVAGEPQDPKKACPLAQKTREYVQGMAIYALCLLEGHLPGGRAQGYAWLLKAAAGGNDLAKSLAPEWEKRLTKEEVDEAKRLLPNLK